MAKKPDQRDPMAREVDRLLRQLPGADPTLKGDPDPGPAEGTRMQMSGPRPAAGRTLRARRTEPPEPWGVWARLAGAAVLGMALTQWPYRSECGWPLYGYVAAVGVVLLASGWTAVAAWQLRMGAAHALALIAGFWGVVLAAEQILPRVGYAAETRYWRCESLHAAQAAAAAAAAAVRVNAAPIAAPAGDSLATDSASAGAGGQLQSVGRGR